MMSRKQGKKVGVWPPATAQAKACLERSLPRLSKMCKKGARDLTCPSKKSQPFLGQHEGNPLCVILA